MGALGKFSVNTSATPQVAHIFCNVCVKDRGYQQPILPKLDTMYIANPKVAAYVMKVEDIETKELLFFEPEQTYLEAETENSWWRKL